MGGFGHKFVACAQTPDTVTSASLRSNRTCAKKRPPNGGLFEHAAIQLCKPLGVRSIGECGDGGLDSIESSPCKHVDRPLLVEKAVPIEEPGSYVRRREPELSQRPDD